MKTTILGLDDLRATLQRLGDRAPSFVATALYREAERIMTIAKGLTPVQTGALRASGQVAQPQAQGSRVVVTLGFGNASVNYAIPVHERMDRFHPTGQAKFLEQPLNEARSGMDARLADDVRREIERAAR